MIGNSKEEMRRMFNVIASTYDFINHLCSFGTDIYWRHKLVKYLPNITDMRLLDLATGTGDQIIAIIRKRQVSVALGVDLSHEMIRCAQSKIIDKPYLHRVTLMEGDATDLFLDDESVDCITMSFGIRNVHNRQRCLEESYRVLAPRGKLLFLEFSLPKNRIVKGLYLLYLRHVIPCIAGWISRKKDAYRYLDETIEAFPNSKEFCQRIKRAGFQNARYHPLTFGIATLYIGEKAS